MKNTDSEKRAKILVVEDETIIGMEILSRLEKLGYEVPLVVGSGQEAISKAAELQPDLVLMDITLNGTMDGVEAADEIKNQFAIPVIFLTADADSQTIQRARLTEPFGYLIKPFEERALHSSIEMALYKAQAEQERKNLIDELREALSKVRQLSGLLPICSACKKIRNDKGYWSQIESYIQTHSEAEFTHSICPPCAKRLYPDVVIYKDDETSSSTT